MSFSRTLLPNVIFLALLALAGCLSGSDDDDGPAPDASDGDGSGIETDVGDAGEDAPDDVIADAPEDVDSMDAGDATGDVSDASADADSDPTDDADAIATDADDTTDTASDTADACLGADCPVADACSVDDLSAISSAGFGESLEDCRVDCVFDRECFVGCAARALRITPPCAACVTELETCAQSNCSALCDRDPGLCRTCIEDTCGPDFGTCATGVACFDLDQDGFGTGTECDGGDCDDRDADTNPRAPEICGDFTDNDCDELIDCRDVDECDAATECALDCPGQAVGDVELGAMCILNADCASGVCEVYQDAPAPTDGRCVFAPVDCSTRFFGTVLDIARLDPVAGANVDIAALLQAATNPTGAMAIASGATDADGRFDAISDGPVSAPLSLQALTSASGYYLTASTVAFPFDGASSYAVASELRDVLIVPEASLDDWSDQLSMDASIDPGLLPLGESGGFVGVVRSADGRPIAGAVVRSTNDVSGALVRYLNDDGTMNEQETSDVGIFVIVDPALPETFEVEVGGTTVGGFEAASARNAVFTAIVTVD